MSAPEGYTCATMKDFIGHDFGSSEPQEVNQIRINTFADVTGDHQWIHVHPEMAKKNSPFGTPVEKGKDRLLVKVEATTTIQGMPKPAIVAEILAMVVT